MSNRSWLNSKDPNYTRRQFDPNYKPARQDPRHQEKKGPREFDRNSCPAGWDASVWELTLQFEQAAAREGIQLATGRPVIYSLLRDRCDSFRDGLYTRHKRWSVDGVNVHATWQEIVSAAISRHFRDYQEDEYAADYFCGPVVFNDMIREVREHGANLYGVRKLEERYGSLDYNHSYAEEDGNE